MIFLILQSLFHCDSEPFEFILHELEHVRHSDVGFYNSLQILKVEGLQKYKAEY